MDFSDKKGGRRYFIQEHLHREVFHGGLCNIDAEKIFVNLGYEPIEIPCHYDFSFKAKLIRILFIIRTFVSLPGHSTVLFQYPVYARLNRLLLRLLLLRPGIKLVCFIYDIDGIRGGEEKVLRREISFYRKCNCFIVHNEEMLKWLKERVKVRNYGILHLFDYLSSPVNVGRSKSAAIVFAANLEKSPFVRDLHLIPSRELHFNVYGKGDVDLMKDQSNVTFKGVHPPYTIPELLEGSFGLVWDGTAIETCSGSYGEYLLYNSQHKLSLYILSGLPVIIWKHAATAELVKKYNIGVIIESLHEIEERIGLLREEEYDQMVQNLKPLAARMSKGQFLQSALAEVLDI